MYSDEGQDAIYIDNVLQATVNCSNSTRLSQQVIYSNQSLPSGSHTVKVVKVSGTYLVLDGLIVTGAALPVIHNDTDPSFSVSGDTWNYSNNRNVGDYNNDLHYMTVNNSYWNFQFTGTGADYITETGTGSGHVQMYVDGVYQSTVQCYASSLKVQQTVYSIHGLSPGVHNLGGVKQDGTYMQVDAIKVYP